MDKKQRRKSRKTSLAVLYSNDVANVSTEDIINKKATLPHISEIDEYSKKLIEGTISHQEEIDKSLNRVSKNWTLERMSSTDRCLLRQTVFEMLYCDDVPISVSINEAVELAKEYGGEDDSHKFVNGVLGKIASDIEGE